MADQPALETCALCGKPIGPGDKAMFRDVPEKGLVRVHILCVVKSRIQRVRRRPT